MGELLEQNRASHDTVDRQHIFLSLPTVEYLDPRKKLTDTKTL